MKRVRRGHCTLAPFAASTISLGVEGDRPAARRFRRGRGLCAEVRECRVGNAIGTTAMNSSSAADTGKLVLRLVLGLLIILHGISKIMNGLGPIPGVVEKAGLPQWFAYLAYVGEVLAPLLLIIGFWTRIAAIIVAINMTFAVYLVHTSQFFTLNKQGGWALELQGMYFFVAIAIALLGAGRFSAGGAAGRFN
jgi:putative oxidoreductase